MLRVTILAVAAALLAGCASPAPAPSPTATSTTTPSASPTAAPTPVAPALRGILAGAFEPAQPYGEPAPVTIGSGANAFTLTAYPGYLHVLTSPTATPTQVRAALAPLAGEIVAQVPALGLYEARVAPGRESDAVALLADEPWLAVAGPLVPLATSAQGAPATRALAPRALANDAIVLDDARTPLAACDGATHLDATRAAFAGALQESPAGFPSAGGALLLDGPFVPSLASQGSVAREVAAIAQAATDAGRVVVLEIPLQAAGATVPDEGALLAAIAWALHAMPDDVRAHLVVVQGLGNGGLDLTPTVDFLLAAMPRANGSLLLVGGVGYEPGAANPFPPDAAANSAASPGVLLDFSTPTNLTIRDATCSVGGVSVAASTTAALVTQLARSHAELNATRIVALARAQAVPMDPAPGYPHGYALAPLLSWLEEALAEPGPAPAPTPTATPSVAPTPAPRKPTPELNVGIDELDSGCSLVRTYSSPEYALWRVWINASGNAQGPNGTYLHVDAYSRDQYGPDGTDSPKGNHVWNGEMTRSPWPSTGASTSRHHNGSVPSSIFWDATWNDWQVTVYPDGTASDANGKGLAKEKLDFLLRATLDNYDYDAPYNHAVATAGCDASDLVGGSFTGGG